jgi:uncharacterized protein YcbK (DUF882 family)
MRLTWIAVVTAALAEVAAAQPQASSFGIASSAPTETAGGGSSKKAAYLAAKARTGASAKSPRASSRRIGARPPPVLSLYNTWTHEWLALDANVRTGLPAGPVINRFLRCHFTNQPTTMDARLAQVLRDASRHFRKLRIDIISGFRSPKYNLMLRKKGREVARDSQHTHGDAVDFRLPGVSTRSLEKWARRLRLGGVGLYLDSDFIHVDTGPIRSWRGS